MKTLAFDHRLSLENTLHETIRTNRTY